MPGPVRKQSHFRPDQQQQQTPVPRCDRGPEKPSGQRSKFQETTSAEAAAAAGPRTATAAAAAATASTTPITHGKTKTGTSERERQG